MERRIGTVLRVLGLLLGVAGAGTAQAQNTAAGQRAFAQCSACHTINAGGRNGVGPNLHGIVGRKAAAIEGFRYSAAMRDKAQQGWSWTADNLREYIRNPRAAVPGTSMAYAGMRNDEQLNNLIGYLEQESR